MDPAGVPGLSSLLEEEEEPEKGVFTLFSISFCCFDEEQQDLAEKCVL